MKNLDKHTQTIAWYDTNAHIYAQKVHNLISLDLLKDFSKLLQKDAKVLDAGCGSGRDTEMLTKLGHAVVGIDLSKGMIIEAQNRYPQLSFRQGSFLSLPFADETFDGVWAHASLVHLPTFEDAGIACTEFFRVLKKGGILHLYVKAKVGDDKFAVVTDSLSNHERFFQFFTQREIKKLMKKSGFTILSLSQFGEKSKFESGRSEVEWICVFAKK